MISGSLWNYYREEEDNFNYNASNVKSFKYKTKIAGKIQTRPAQPGNEGDFDRPSRPPVPNLSVEVTIPLKHLGNFWRSLDLPLIKYEVEFDLLWTKDCVLVECNNNNITGINFKITSTTLYVSEVTLPINNNIKFLENITQGFKKQFLGINVRLK